MENTSLLGTAKATLDAALNEGRTAILALGAFAVVTGLAIYYVRKLGKAGKA